MLPVTAVPQLTPYTCSLACLESYFLDLKKPFPQHEILKQHYPILEIQDPQHKHEYGAADDSKLIKLCMALGFTAVLYKDFRQKEVEKAFGDALTKDHGVLILALWNNQNNHCVRLSRIKAPGDYEVMIPYFYPPNAGMIDVSFADLVSWGFRYLIIS